MKRDYVRMLLGKLELDVAPYLIWLAPIFDMECAIYSDYKS